MNKKTNKKYLKLNTPIHPRLKKNKIKRKEEKKKIAIVDLSSDVSDL